MCYGGPYFWTFNLVNYVCVHSVIKDASCWRLWVDTVGERSFMIRSVYSGF